MSNDNIDNKADSAQSQDGLSRRLMNDQEFADLMEAEMHAGADKSITSIDEIAKQRNWREITTRLDLARSKKAKRRIGVQTISVAAAVVVAIGAVTLLQQQGASERNQHDGVKGIATSGIPASVMVFHSTPKNPLVPITDGIAPKDADLVFRTNATRVGVTAIIILAAGTSPVIHINDSPQNPTDEVLMHHGEQVVTYRLSVETPEATVCAIAAETREGVRKLATTLELSEAPLLTGLMDPDSACKKIRMDPGEPR